MSGARKDPEVAVLCTHNASAQQVTQNTVKANVLQNRTIFLLRNTGSYQVIAYMGIISALKILSGLQRLFPYLCEHGYGHNFITNSNALKQLLTAPAPRVPSGDLSSYTTPLHPLQPHFKGNRTAKPQSDTPRNPCMDKPQPSKADGAGQPVPLSLFLPEEF